MPFQKGQSGNPAGRPPGSRNRATLFAEALLEGEAEMIMRNAIRAAVNDVPWAMRLCFDRLSPRPRARAAPIAFELPQISTLADIPPAIAKISSALAAGDITIDEAERYTAVLERWSRMLQSAERNEKPAREIKFGWIDPRTGAPGTGGINYIIDYGDGAGPRAAGPRAIDNPSLVVNEDAEPGRTAASPDRAIDNPIVVRNGDAEPGRTDADPDRAIDNPVVVRNGDAEPGRTDADPDRVIDNPIVVRNGGAEAGRTAADAGRIIDNPIVVSNGDAEPGRTPADPEPDAAHSIKKLSH
jgi:Family of unknown function (DUF5681)